MSFQIAYTDRDTLLIACGGIVTEVPLTPPSDPPSSGPFGTIGGSNQSGAPPAPTPPRSAGGGQRPPYISAPKHGPRTMLILPGKFDIGTLPYGQSLLRRSPTARIVSQQDLERLTTSLVETVPGDVYYSTQMTASDAPIVSLSMSRDVMATGFNTRPIEQVFEKCELMGQVALRLNFESDG